MKKKCTLVHPPFMVRCIQFSVFLVAFLLSAGTAFSQIKISGLVSDAKGAPLEGVSVLVKGSNTGVSTDVGGRYFITVPSTKSVITFSSVGFTDKQETVGNRTVINVGLTPGTSDLEEVVVIGYGQTLKKSNLTGSISSVSNKQIMERQPINIYDALQGQAAGVLIMNDSGEPGAEGSVTVRGNNTFTAEGNQPLWIVDGVLTDNPSAINPNDIERIEVLKDAASASIYGARSAAGVILVTTKKGKEGKTRLDLQYSHIFGKLAHKIQEPNARDLRYYRKVQNGNLNGTSGSFTDSLNPSFNTDNDLEELLLGNPGNRDDIKLGVSGGQKGLNFFGSINFINDKGIALNTYNRSIQSRINTEFQASPKFKYSTNLTFYWSNGNFTSINNSVRPVFDRPSYLRIFNPDGSLTSYLASKRNPVANALLEDNTKENFKTSMNHQIDYQFSKDLKLTTSFNAQLTSYQQLYFAPRFLDDNGNENFGRQDLNKTFSWLFQSFLNYNKKIGNSTFTGLLGIEKDRVRNDYSHLEGYNFTVEAAHFVTGQFINDLSKQSTKANAVSTASAFGRLGYDYKGRYLVQGTYRRDASSRFGPDNRVGNFFSGSAAWRFTDESFLHWMTGALTDGKLRVSWGQTGNDRVGYYDYMQLLSVGVYSYSGLTNGANVGAGSAGTTTTTTFGNSELRWESTEQKNIGLDLQFFKGRLSLTLDGYIKTTTGLLYDRPVPRETGYLTKKVNLGSIETRGLELQGNAAVISSKRFQWNLSGNIALERGKILELADHNSFITGKWFVEEGGRIGNFYGWQNLGIYPTDAHNAYTANWEKLTPVGIVITQGTTPRLPAAGSTSPVSVAGYELNGKPYTGTVYKKMANGAPLLGGDVEWVDLDNNGIIDDADRQIIGNSQPDYYFGIINNFSYRQWSLNVIVNGTVGGVVYNSFKEKLTNNSSSNGPALPEAIYGAWVRQGQTDATYPYFPDKDQRGSQRGGANSFFLEDASFFRLSSARLTYRLTPAVAKKAFMKSASLYIYGTNILTWTNYTGFDPEFSSGNALQPGDDNGKYPKRRELGLGLNIQL
jgi:TonB-linked SusC/RagA family outer membrane protein